MSQRPDNHQREIERHIVRTVRKLAEPDLVRLLAELRRLTADNRTEARHV